MCWTLLVVLAFLPLARFFTRLSVPVQDNKLAEVVARLPQPTKWMEVGKEMDLKTQQCRSRWLTHHLPLQQGRHVGDWSEDEVR